MNPRQTTLARLFIATAVVAVAAASVQFIRTTGDPTGQFEAALLVPIVASGAVGVVFRRVGDWLFYGVMTDFALMAGALALWAIGATLAAFGW